MARILPDVSPIIVSNRGPFEVRADGSTARGAGGVVTALTTLAQAFGAEWIAIARTDAERKLVDEQGPTQRVKFLRSGPSTVLHYVMPERDQYDQYYSVIANPVLWFIQHYLWDLAYEPLIDSRIHSAWTDGYVEVNRQVADRVVAIARQAPRRPLVMIHDYHLYLVGRLVRRAVPRAIVHHFIHIPWPTPQYWKVLPKPMRDAILEGLLGCDVAGFQSSLDVRNFLLTCEENLGLQVDERERAVMKDGRVILARHYPISIDVGATLRLSSSKGVAREERRLKEWRPPMLIVRVDRTDPSKNIVRGFLAYEKLLRLHPELQGRVQFWAFLQPSRTQVAAYTSYLRRLRKTAGRINAQLGQKDWQPIRLELGESLRKAVAAYRNFDVLLVNPVYDGINLVAKEGALVNRTNGVIVLSENAGAHEELQGHVVSINPFDVERTAEALYEGLMMGEDERRRRNDGAREVVRSNDIGRWISRQVQDLRDLVLAATPSASRS